MQFPEKLNFGEDIAFSVKIGLTNSIYYRDEFVGIFYNRHSKSTVQLQIKNIQPLKISSIL